MDKILELELRQSEARQELSGLLETDADSEKIGTLTVEIRSLDRQISGHKLTRPEPESREVKGSPEGRELRQLINKSNVGEIFDAALGKRAVDGASAEIQKHYGLDVNQVPLAMLVKGWPGDDDPGKEGCNSCSDQRRPRAEFDRPLRISSIIGGFPRSFDANSAGR